MGGEEGALHIIPLYGHARDDLHPPALRVIGLRSHLLWLNTKDARKPGQKEQPLGRRGPELHALPLHLQDSRFLPNHTDMHSTQISTPSELHRQGGLAGPVLGGWMERLDGPAR